MSTSPVSPLTPAVGAAPPTPARAVAAQFESLLVREMFAPLSKSLGFYGDAVLGEAARTLALGERGGLTDALERAIADREP